MPLAITITIRVPTDNGNEKGAGTVQMKEDKRSTFAAFMDLSLRRK